MVKKKVNMALILGVSAENSKKNEQEVQLALTEAGYTCACCGIQSEPNNKGKLSIEKNGFMYLVVDEEGKENVVCTLCYYSLNMDRLFAPKFIYYPWLSQEQINYLLHYFYTIMQAGADSLKKKASACVFQLNNFSFHLNKIDPTLVNEPSKLIHLLKWLQMEEPENYRLRNDKYLKGIRLIHFSIPTVSPDIMAVFKYSESLLREESMEDKWQAVYLNHVKARQEGSLA